MVNTPLDEIKLDALIREQFIIEDYGVNDNKSTMLRNSQIQLEIAMTTTKYLFHGEKKQKSCQILIL